jgi:protein arginine kinase activator
MENCDDCGVNPANVHLTHVEQGESQTFHLCEDCARKRGVPLPDADVIAKGIAAIMGFAGASHAETQVKVTVKPAGDGDAVADAVAEPPPADIRCPKCGMLFSQFKSSGWLGCAECYESFDERINRILLQIHGSDGHKGKAYGKPAARRGGKRDIARLRRELDDAIKNERFEQAAVIRDTLIGLKTGVK